MADQFCFVPGAAGYGARVYIHKDAPEEVHNFFANQSMWRGADKQGENYLSYELKNDYKWILDRI